MPEGFIIAAAAMDECASNLSLKGKQWFAKMGSKEIGNIDYREGFSFIGISGRNNAVEKKARCR